MLGARWGIILWPRGSARFSLCLVKGSVNSHRYKLRAEEAGGISEGATGKRTVPSCLTGYLGKPVRCSLSFSD